MPTYISLLRGINVGGNKVVKMADLKKRYEMLGFTSVQTLLQSGNVVFESDQTDTNAIITQIEADIMQNFGFESRIIIRTASAWQALVANNPFSADLDASKRVVMCLDQAPDKSQFDAFVVSYQGGNEQMRLQEDDLYLYYPDGLGRSKLTNTLIEKQLGIMGTVRNWNTVMKLQAML